MASGQTENYGLSQWAAEDAVLREEFNRDNAKVDVVLANMVTKETFSQVLDQVSKKGEIMVGVYIGDGQSSRTISLEFSPKAVVVWANGYNQFSNNSYWGGIAIDGKSCPGISVADTGFVVSGSEYHTNVTGTSYIYLAIKA